MKKEEKTTATDREKTQESDRFFKLEVTDSGGDKLNQAIKANGFNKMEIIGMLERAKYHLLTDK